MYQQCKLHCCVGSDSMNQCSSFCSLVPVVTTKLLVKKQSPATQGVNRHTVYVSSCICIHSINFIVAIILLTAVVN